MKKDFAKFTRGFEGLFRSQKINKIKKNNFMLQGCLFFTCNTSDFRLFSYLLTTIIITVFSIFYVIANRQLYS